MKQTLTILTLFLTVFCQGQPGLVFRKDSTFKILQLTDTHITFRTEKDAAASEKVFERIGRYLTAEDPDLVMLTGDIVTWGAKASYWTRLMDTLDRHSVPYCICLGNHDAEGDLAREDIADLVTSRRLSLNKKNREGELADVHFRISGRDGKPAFCVYSLDSHDYSKLGIGETYGWFTFNQVDWFRREAAEDTERNGGRPLPGMMFFHIPLREYVFVGCKDDTGFRGRCAEDPCPQGINTGMFGAIVESGSVVATFVGHDHDNDYVCMKNGIALVYGRYSGDETVYNNLRHGCRVISIKEGSKDFETWIREEDGRIVDRCRVVNGKIEGE